MIRKLALLSVVFAAPALAQSGYADLGAIDRAVEQFTGVPQGAPGGAVLPIDRRLKLAPCRSALSLGWYGARRDTVEVACPVPGGWRLYVPLAGSAANAAAAAPLIARGDAITVAVRGEGFAVSQPGEALESGAEGAWIKVRTLGPNAPVLRARVLRPGLVGIDLP